MKIDNFQLLESRYLANFILNLLIPQILTKSLPLRSDFSGSFYRGMRPYELNFRFSLDLPIFIFGTSGFRN